MFVALNFGVSGKLRPVRREGEQRFEGRRVTARAGGTTGRPGGAL